MNTVIEIGYVKVWEDSPDNDDILHVSLNCQKERRILGQAAPDDDIELIYYAHDSMFTNISIPISKVTELITLLQKSVDTSVTRTEIDTLEELAKTIKDEEGLLQRMKRNYQRMLVGTYWNPANMGDDEEDDDYPRCEKPTNEGS